MEKMILCVMLMPVMCYCEVVSVSSEAAVYEYVPKVIIEGKWGKGPGEFGVISDPMDAEYLDIAQYPHSLGVNSEGDIYVLDQVNNRIQKFDKEGKYVKSISVLGLVDNKNNPIVEVKRERVFEVKGYPFIEGINIVIDSKDRMYYYLKRSSYNAEGVKVSEAGEVWEIENDKVTRKWEVPLGEFIDRGQGLMLNQKDDSLWIYNIKEKGKKTNEHYDVKGKRKYSEKARDEKIAKERNKNKKKFIDSMADSGLIDLKISKNGVIVTRRELVIKK